MEWWKSGMLVSKGILLVTVFLLTNEGRFYQ